MSAFDDLRDAFGTVPDDEPEPIHWRADEAIPDNA